MNFQFNHDLSGTKNKNIYELSKFLYSQQKRRICKKLKGFRKKII